jgi:hypothetical protein
MLVKISDHVKGATVHRPYVAPALAKLLAAADLTAPVAGAKIDIDSLDAKLAGLPVGQRLEIKCALRGAGMIG